MDENICLHAIYAKNELCNGPTFERNTLCTLEKILKSKALLSRRLQKNNDFTYFNGLDYISLCDYSKRNEKYLDQINSYEGYIKHSLSMAFPKEKLDIIVPEMIEVFSEGNYYLNMRTIGLTSKQRYSDMADEVQVKDSISLELMIGITLPIDKMINKNFDTDKNITQILKQIENIIIMLEKYNYNVPLYDINTFLPLNNESNVKELIRKI